MTKAGVPQFSPSFESTHKLIFIRVYWQHKQWFWWKPSVFHSVYSSSWCRRCMRVSTTPPAARNYSSPKSSLTSARVQNTPTPPDLSHTDQTVGSFLCHPWNSRPVHKVHFTVRSHIAWLWKNEYGYSKCDKWIPGIDSYCAGAVSDTIDRYHFPWPE